MDCFIGRKGSGKSYNVVATVILPFLREGRDIVTNIPLTQEIDNDSKIKGNVYSFDLDNLPVDFFDIKNIKKGAVYVIDEVQKLWPAGLQVMQFPRDHKKFISENRHMVGENGYSTDIVLVTQDTELIAKYPRNLIDKTYRCKKLDAAGMSKIYRVDVYDGPVPLSLKSSSNLINSFTGKYKEEVFKYYKSHTLNDSVYSSGLEVKNKNASIFSNPFIRYGLPLALFVGIFAIFNVLNYFKTAGGMVEPAIESIGNNQVVDSDIATNNAQPSVLNFSKIYRISHSVYSTNIQTVYITDNFSLIPIPFSSCEYIEVIGLTCIYNNEVINFFSGELPNHEQDNNINNMAPIF